jgi:predicted metal-binding membrane protein
MPAHTQSAPAPGRLLTPSALRGLRAPAFRWSIAPALAAWLLLLWLWSQDRALALCVAPRGTLLDGILAEIAAGFATIDPVRWAGEWALMIAAMMFPLLVPMIGHVAAKSFADRRERSVALFIAGYALTWAIAAAAASVALVAVRAGFSSVGLASSAGLIGCALAALWQLSPAKARAVNRCHGTVALRPFGAAADRDAVRFGVLHGTRCVRACLPTMVLPLAGGLGIGAMAVIFAILLAERARHTPQYGLSAMALLLLGLTSPGAAAA